jgi:hypothetical protein
MPSPQWGAMREAFTSSPFKSGEKKIEIYYEAHTIMEKLSKHSQRVIDRWPSMGLSSGGVSRCPLSSQQSGNFDFISATPSPDQTTNNCTRQIKFQQSLICILIKSHLNIC